MWTILPIIIHKLFIEIIDSNEYNINLIMNKSKSIIVDAAFVDNCER